MEVRDSRFRDLVEPEGLAAIVTGGVPVSVGNEGLPRLRGEPPRGLDGVDVEELFLPAPDIEAPANLRDLRGSCPCLEVVDSPPESGEPLPELRLPDGIEARREGPPEDPADLLEAEEGFIDLLDTWVHGHLRRQGEVSCLHDCELTIDSIVKTYKDSYRAYFQYILMIDTHNL